MSLAAPASVREYCLRLLEAGDLESKLSPPLGPGGRPLDDRAPGEPVHLDQPVRCAELALRDGSDRLPELGRLVDPAARRLCLARFANHELMAVELFAWALVTWPGMPSRLRQAFVAVLGEEQLHLRLYLERLLAHGASLGDFSLSGYLWRHVPAIRAGGPLAFLCAMGLTFEQANLDYTLVYRDAFRAAGDEETALVIDRVHRDEIAHVRVAMSWVRRLKRPGQGDVAAYCESVPFPLTAARAKGRRLDLAARRCAGLSEELITHVREARPYGPIPPSAAGAWLVANVGAEEAGAQGRGARAMVRQVGRLWSHLFADGVRIAPADTLPSWPRSLGHRPPDPVFAWLPGAGYGIAWLATEASEAEIRSRGLLPSGPPAGIAHEVHDKGFALTAARAAGREPECLAGLIDILGADELADPGAARRVAERVRGWPSWIGGQFLIKPRWGTSGRGQVTGTAARELPRAVLDHLAAAGGAVLEPWLERRADLSVQLRVDPGGKVEVLATLHQLVSRGGGYLGNRGVLDRDGRVCAGHPCEAEVAAAARQVVEAAARRGFVGPCGVDAFTFVGPNGDIVLRPVCELNARFTTGTIAVGLLHRALPLVPDAGAFCLMLHRRTDVALPPDITRLVLDDKPGRFAPLLLLATRPDLLDRAVAMADPTGA